MVQVAKRRSKKSKKETKVKTKEEIANELLFKMFEYSNGDATVLLELCANISAKSLIVIELDAVFEETGESPTLDFLISNFTENVATFARAMKETVKAPVEVEDVN